MAMGHAPATCNLRLGASLVRYFCPAPTEHHGYVGENDGGARTACLLKGCFCSWATLAALAAALTRTASRLTRG
jgi:hypothetical protein